MTVQQIVVVAVVSLLFTSGIGAAENAKSFRPPAVPLVTHDPYFSTWAMSDRLTDGWPKHWTGATMGMCGMVRIDGKPYRLIGPQPNSVPAMEQLSVEALPTRSIYRFEAGGVEITLTFMSPLLPNDLDVLARPVTYITWDAQSKDSKSHAVSVYLDVSGEWAVHSADQQVVWSRYKLAGMDVMRIGTEEQPVLKRAGDGVRRDWGYLCLAVPGMDVTDNVISSDRSAREEFASAGKLPASDDMRMPRAASDDWPVLACTLDLGKVGKTTVSRHVMLAYDETYAIEYLQRKLRPYWRRTGMDIGELLSAAGRDYASLTQRSIAFDAEFMADAAKVGGEKYAQLCALAYRQCLAAHGLAADIDGSPMMFSKENSSNGCIGTVDVIYPTSPFFMLFSPELLKANLTPVLEYARSPRWPHPFAPHDLGTYPLANGQVYGGGERTEENQMPVEESGNMILMMAAIAKIEGNAAYAAKYWSLLTRWAEYLREKGMDPENQLCTDDFMGHLAHNANLSVKAIEALGAYAMLCDMAGKKDKASEYRKLAEEMASKWIEMADDGDHFRLAFDKPDTWSQKYNLVWDKLLDLNLFPPEVADKEIAYYKTKQNRFGLPLDSRATLTKTDWVIWTAALAESRSDFKAFVGPVYDYFNETTKRVPMADLYWTDNPDEAWLIARPVIGGIYIKMLSDPAVWKKYSR